MHQKIQMSWLAAALLAAGSVSAQAAEPGLLQFENVRVINAPQAETAPATQAGLMAAKDSAGSALRDVTAEEAAALTAPAAPAAKSVARVAATRVVKAVSGRGAMVPESRLAYSVAVRNADGSISDACVTGEDKAQALLKDTAQIQAARAKEHAHDR